jgi:hypothetical protein
MALEATHIRFSEDIKEKLDVTDIEKYISGTLYPDTRYMTKISREMTHPADFINDPSFFEDDFRKGWYSHLIYDKILKEYTDQELSGFFSGSNNGDDLYVCYTALKVLQDLNDARSFEINKFLPCLDYANNPNAEDLGLILDYNHLNQKLYQDPQQLSFEAYAEVMSAIGMLSDLVIKVIAKCQEYQSNSKIVEFLEHVYPNTLAIYLK